MLAVFPVKVVVIVNRALDLFSDLLRKRRKGVVSTLKLTVSIFILAQRLTESVEAALIRDREGILALLAAKYFCVHVLSAFCFGLLELVDCARCERLLNWHAIFSNFAGHLSRKLDLRAELQLANSDLGCHRKLISCPDRRLFNW